jgi:predicted nuclease of predicted toxin-antitoxin system
MKLLANENIPRIVVHALRAAGHDVLWASVEMAGAADDAVLLRARAESRIIVTLDKDFGELAYRRGRSAAAGVVLLRFALTSPEFAASRIVQVFRDYGDWHGQFAVIDDFRIRVRPMPVLSGEDAENPD